MQLSYSGATKYITSPMSFFLHYFLRLRPIQTGSALVFGSALDAGFNSLLTDKKNGLAPDLTKAGLAFYDEFIKVEPGAIKFSKADFDETLFTEEELDNDVWMIWPPAWYSLQRKGRILIEEYASQVLPRIQQVYEIQKEISLTNEVGDTFTGIIDLIARIDDKILICDNKSSSIRYAQNAVAESEQLASYYEAMKDDYKLDGACYIVIQKKIRKVKEPRVQIDFIFGDISENLIIKTFQDYENVLDGVKNGRFHCTRSERDGCCSAPWGCTYRAYCESNGEDTTGLTIQPERKK